MQAFILSTGFLRLYSFLLISFLEQMYITNKRYFLLGTLNITVVEKRTEKTEKYNYLFCHITSINNIESYKMLEK